MPIIVLGIKVKLYRDLVLDWDPGQVYGLISVSNGDGGNPSPSGESWGRDVDADDKRS